MSGSIGELIRRLEARDVKLQVVEGRLRVDAPKGALTPELRQTLTQNKPQLISALQPDWAGDAKKVIDAVPDDSLRPLLRNFYEQTVAVIADRYPRPHAEQQAFGLLLFELIRLGIDSSAPSEVQQQ